MPSRNLIFDLGMSNGEDTAFYLGKGFRVVAVEAQPDLCRAASERFSGALQSGQLTIIDRAIWETADERITFYVRDVWSSVFKDAAERDGLASATVEVRTTTIPELFSRYGVPHYLKCDIEGGEDIVLSQLGQAEERPNFVSMEDPNGATAIRLATLGYDRFQMLNQGYLQMFRPPKPPREGGYMDAKFTDRMSGLFGFELPANRWVDEATLQRQLQHWASLREPSVNPIYKYACKRWGKLARKGWLIPSGWSDIHATTAARLREP